MNRNCLCLAWLILGSINCRASFVCFVIAITSFALPANSQDAQPSKTSAKFPCDPEAAAHYTAYRISEAMNIDGQLTEKGWTKAPRSPRFTDILTGKPTLYDTKAAVLWDAQNLYVGYWVEEPNVKATFTEYGSPIYYNNDVEVFIAGKDAYYEFEINAL